MDFSFQLTKIARHFAFGFILLLFISGASAHGQGFLFEENKGQWHPDVLFRTEIPGGYLFITKNGMKYLYVHPEDVEKYLGHNHHEQEDAAARIPARNNMVRMQAIEVNFENISTALQTENHHPQPSSTNYLRGNDPANWATDVKKYEEVWVKNIYSGIHMRYYHQDNNLKYDLVVDPKSDPSQIRMSYNGASNLKLKNGQLEVYSDFGKSLELRPITFQDKNSKRSKVESRYALKGNSLSFNFPKGYDKEYPLVIDPTLIFSTYSGSLADNWGFTATFDDDGNLYSGGIVKATGFPVTSGAFQEDFGGAWDVGILKFDSSGRQLLYATYLGGNEADVPHSIIVNNSGELVVLGTTSSSNFPVTPNAYQMNFLGGTTMNLDPNFTSSTPYHNAPVSGVPYMEGSDIFIAKISNDGRSLLASTLLGGTENDGVMVIPRPFSINLTKNYGDAFRGEVIIDEEDNIYIASYTSSINFPIVNGFQTVYGGGFHDGVVVKMNPDLSQIIWSTYLGGSNQDGLYSIRIDEEKNVIVGGGTLSPDFPTTAGAHQESMNSSDVDGVIAKIKHDGSELLASTFLGTNAYDQVYLLDLDDSQNIYVIGQTQGSYPVSEGIYSNPNSGQFIHKFNSELSSTYFSTVFGSGRGRPDIRPTAFLVNECENLLVSGWGGATNSGYIGGNTHGMPVTENAYQTITDGSDFYLMVLLKDAEEFLYGTFIGEYGGRGDHVDGGTSRFDKRGIVYQSICASCNGSNGFPTTPQAWSANNRSSNCNNAVMKFDLSQLIAKLETDSRKFDNPGINSGCWPLEIMFLNKSVGGIDFFWDFGNGQTSTKKDSILITYQEPGEYNVVLRATDIATCIREDFDYGTITVFDQNFGIMKTQLICEGDFIELNAEGGIEYKWEPAEFLNNPNLKNPIASPDTTTYFKITITNENGCTIQDSVLITVFYNLSVDFDISESSGCSPLDVTFFNKSIGGVDFLWDFGNGQTSNKKDEVKTVYHEPGKYIVSLKVTDPATCPLEGVAYGEITIFDQQFDIMDPQKICFGTQIVLNAEGGEQYRWTPYKYLNNPSLKNPVAKPDETTYFFVEIINEHGCQTMDSVLITVVPDFEVDFSITKKNTCFDSPDIVFANTSIGAESYVWDLGDGTIIEEPEFTYNFNQTDTFMVRLTGKLDICEKSVQRPIRSVKTFIPNIITPNNDGPNDYLIIDTTEPIDLVVYNRWGKKVFDQENYANEFGGEDLAAGVYYYRIIFREDGTSCRGWLHVLK